MTIVGKMANIRAYTPPDAPAKNSPGSEISVAYFWIVFKFLDIRKMPEY